jgi:multidrug efflux pump subunit AcrA (membrane-fusion protein)
MTRRYGIAAGIVLLVSIVVVLSRGGSSAVDVTAAKAARRDLVVSVTSDGTLEPPAGGELRAPSAAVVAEVLVAEGDRVQKGRPLVRLEDPELSQSALTARSSALATAEERARAVAEADSARREADHARSVVESDRRLLAQNAVPRATLEADELASRQADDRLRQAQARVESLEGGRGGGSRVALSAEAARELERRVAALTLRAPSAGIVYGLPRKAGETVTAGQLVASVADPEHLRVRIRVDQPDLPRVAAGQRIAVTFDGLPERRWEGRVLTVPSGVTESGGRQVGEVIGEISDVKPALPPNASVNVEVVVGEKKGALTVPRAAVLRDRDGKSRYVFVPDGRRARRREVGVGLVGLSDVEISSGLSDGDVVLLPGPVPLTDGARIRISAPNKS